MSVCKLYQFCLDCSRNCLDSSPFEMQLIYLQPQNNALLKISPFLKYIYIIIYIYMLNKCVGLMLKEIKKKESVNHLFTNFFEEEESKFCLSLVYFSTGVTCFLSWLWEMTHFCVDGIPWIGYWSKVKCCYWDISPNIQSPV